MIPLSGFYSLYYERKERYLEKKQNNFVQGWNFSGNGSKFSSDGQVVEEGEWEGPIGGIEMFKKKSCLEENKKDLNWCFLIVNGNV